MERERVAKGVKRIAIVDVVVSLSSFASFVSAVYVDREKGTFSHFLVTQDNKLSEADRQTFHVVVTGIIIFMAIAVTGVRISADLSLHRAAQNVKDDPGKVVRCFGRWRAWGTILMVLLLAGIFTFHIILGLDTQLWRTLFLITEIFLIALAIIYVGKCTAEIEKQAVLPSHNVDFKVFYQL